MTNGKMKFLTYVILDSNKTDSDILNKLFKF